MDPGANLDEQRRIIARMLDDDNKNDPCAPQSFVQDALRLAELVQVLDEWIVKGGHLPDDWAAAWGI